MAEVNIPTLFDRLGEQMLGLSQTIKSQGVTLDVTPFDGKAKKIGLTNAPGVFQQLMATVLEGLEHFSTAYLDDIIIWSSSAEEHIRHIQQVFSRLRNHDLKLKLKNAVFSLQKQIN